jgi:hypothetical protein
MTLLDFLAETQAEVWAQMNEGSPYAELVFAEVVMQHLADVGMTFEPVVCHYQAEVGRGRAKLRITGYAVSEGDGPTGLVREPLRRGGGARPDSGLGDNNRRRAMPALPHSLRLGEDGVSGQ